MTHNWYNGLLIGAAAALILWWIIHRIRRTFEDRCTCGRLFQSATYYMEPNMNAPQGIIVGRSYDTYKFLQCRCGALRGYFRQRYVSYLALTLKEMFKPWHLRRTNRVEGMIESVFGSVHMRSRFPRVGLDSPVRPKLKPRSEGFPPNAILMRGHFSSRRHGWRNRN